MRRFITWSALVASRNGIATPGTGLTWTSSNPAVATVDAAGKVTAVALGSTVISATPSSGAGVTVPVRVTAKRVATDSQFLISAFWPPTPEYTNDQQYDFLADADINYIHIRLVGTRLKSSGSDGYLMQVGEIEAYGTPS